MCLKKHNAWACFLKLVLILLPCVFLNYCENSFSVFSNIFYWTQWNRNSTRHVFLPVKAPVLDDSTVSQLCEMGFPLEACRKAVYYTGNTGIDAAMNWIMSHMEDSGVQSGEKLTGKRKYSANSLPGSSLTSLFSVIGCRFRWPSGSARL